MIWEPFVMALLLGLLVSAGLYFAYLWPSVEPLDEEDEESGTETKPDVKPVIPEVPTTLPPDAPSIPPEPVIVTSDKDPEPVESGKGDKREAKTPENPENGGT